MPGPKTNAGAPDRGRELADAAALLFAERGYNRVGMNEIAAAVGITGGAVYRHYGGKRELLARVLFDRLDLLGAALDLDPPDVDPNDRLVGLVDRLVRFGLDVREFSSLAQREARNLAEADRIEFARVLGGASSRVAEVIGAARPELSTPDARVLADAALAICASPSFHTVALSRAKAETVLREAALGVAHSTVFPRAGDDAPVLVPDDEPAVPMRRLSRREQLLGAAIDLFGTSGYGAVRMEDIGAAAGISGPSIYEHFAGKTDLLIAALQRGALGLELSLSAAMASSTSPAAALERAVSSYARFLLEHPRLISVCLTEMVYMPDEERHDLRRTQRDYVAQWASLLASCRPELSAAETLFVTHAVLSVLNNIPRSPWLRTRADAEDVLIALCGEVLGLAVLDRSPA